MNRTTVEVLNFYKEQLKKFKTLGLSKKTEFGTVVTERLINITKKRYMELASRRLAYNKQEPNSNGSI